MHIPKDKRTKLDASSKKGIFCRIQRDIKGIQSICPWTQKIEICKDVIFGEDAAFYKSKRDHLNEIHDEEPAAPRVSETEKEEHVPKNHDMMEPQKPADSPVEVITYKRKPSWARELFQDA